MSLDNYIASIPISETRFENLELEIVATEIRAWVIADVFLYP